MGHSHSHGEGHHHSHGGGGGGGHGHSHGGHGGHGHGHGGAARSSKDIFEPPPMSRMHGAYSTPQLAAAEAQPELEPVDRLSLLCGQGHLDGVVALLEREGDGLIEQLDKQGYSCLHWAALNGRANVARYLLAKPNSPGPNVVGNTPLRQTPVHWAASRGHVDVLRAFVEHSTQQHEVDLSAPDSQGCTPLHIAAQNGETLALHYLVCHGADVAQVDGQNHTALHWAASNGNPNTIIYLLRQNRIDVDHVDQHHSTALHWAVIKGHFRAAKELIQANASTSVKDVQDKTPLEHMRSLGHSRLLLIAERHKYQQLFKHSWRTNTVFLASFPVVAMGVFLYAATFHAWYWALATAAAIVTFVAGYVAPFMAENSLLPCAYAFCGMFWMSSSYVFYVWPLLGDAYQPLHHVFLVCNVLMWATFYRVVRGDPGVLRLPPVDRSNFAAALDDGLSAHNFCTTCLHHRPLRSKHCALCDHCIARFDHHCPWVATCVGAKNHRFFVVWLMALSTCNIIGCIVSTTVALYYTGAADDASLWHTAVVVATDYPFLVWVVVLNFFHVVWFTALTVSQTYFAINNVTTNEVMNWSRYNYLTGMSFNAPHATNYFNNGIVRNVVDFFSGKHRDIMSVPQQN